ncbi:MAG TPA: SulP family inorganic anion transporter [Tepiditoga sp.]|nr:SulP family inorganic anion transporter [Tepiditoga sp.]
MFIPKLFTTLKDYTPKMFLSDLSAGIIVGIIAIPLSIAFAISSGVSPEKGIITAIIGGFIVAVLGGSRVQIAGPTGAFVAIVYGIVMKYGIEGLMISTVMGGVILVLMGFLKLGSVIKFIPYTITSGFTSGIAVIIFTGQINDITGLTAPGEYSFFQKWYYYFSNMKNINFTVFIYSVIAVIFLFLWPKISKKIPASIILIIFSTIINYFFKLNMETIGGKFGEITLNFQMIKFSDINFSDINFLIMPALSIAVLGAIESLLSAVVSDGMIGGNHRSNMELVAQGVANIFSGFTGGIPVTGAIARTAANVKNGGRTPVAGIIHSVTILFIMIFLTPYLKYIPLSALACVLIFVSVNMFETESFKDIKRNHIYDTLVFVITFILTFSVNLIAAIEVGIVLAAFLFMKRMTDVSGINYFKNEIRSNEIKDTLNFTEKNKEIEIYEINGPFFFGAAERLLKINRQMNYFPKFLVLKMTQVPFIDSTALNALKKFAFSMKKKGTDIFIAEAGEEVKNSIKKYGINEISYINEIEEIYKIYDESKGLA